MRRPPLVLIPQHFGSLVFDRRTSRYLPFDQQTTAILRRTRRESIEVIARDLGDRERVLAFYEQFYARGFFDLDGQLLGHVLTPERLPADHLLGPLAVHLEIVARCNLTCRHCFAGTLPRQGDPLTLAELDPLFGTLAGLGSFRLGLTGGEPLLRPDLIDILDLATGHGLHPCLTTNGLLITERIARELGRRELVWLNVSLEGANPETNDPVRGAGTFERVREKLRVLARHARFTLAFTITSNNAAEVEACAALAAEVGAHTAVFRPLYPVGVARAHPELMPTYAQYAGALERLATLDPTDHDLFAIDPFSPQSRAETRARTYANEGCGAGNLVCSISVHGDVNPCSFLGPEQEAGSIREQPFDVIWNESRGFRSIRDLPGGAGAFQGGCRARAQVAGGSINAPDPWHREYLAARGALPPPLGNVHVSRPLPLARGH